MIVNNYQAMSFAQELASQELTPTDVLDLHRVVTEDTLDDPDDAGRLQGPDGDRIGVYWHDGTLLHRPPAADELPGRLQAMCDFANGRSTGDGFIHPVVRAIVLHFWLAYDHPFSDGNDLTYFVIYQLTVIERSITRLHDHLARKTAELREIESLIHGSPHLNHRQLVVMRDALRDPSEPFTINAQARRHRVAYESARSDLLGLAALGLLSRQKAGKKHVFRALPGLPDRLRKIGDVSPART